MSEDTILTIVAILLIGGALAIGFFFRDTKGMGIFVKLMSPFTWLKDRVDPNYWAERIGNKTGIYDKAHNSKFAQKTRDLKGWRWWTYQIVGGILFVVVMEFLLRQIGMTMLPF